jgi:hypothetical protein
MLLDIKGIGPNVQSACAPPNSHRTGQSSLANIHATKPPSAADPGEALLGGLIAAMHYELAKRSRIALTLSIDVSIQSVRFSVSFSIS